MYRITCQLDEQELITKPLMIYEKVQGRADSALSDHEVVIQVNACCFKRKKVTHLIRRQFLEFQENKPSGVGGAGVGIITHMGKAVTDFKIGTCVVFVIPENSRHSGVAHSCIVPCYFCFVCPPALNKTDVAVMVDALIPTYYALQNRVTRGDTVLICGAHTPHGQVIIQTLYKKGCKIVVYLSREFEKDILSPYRHMVDHFFEGWVHRSNVNQIRANLIKESDHLGYSMVLCLQPSDPRYAEGILNDDKIPTAVLPLSTTVMVLAAGGHLVLAKDEQAINKDMSAHLFAKGCSIHYLNPTGSLCAPLRLGSLLNYLIAQLESLELKEITVPQPIQTVTMEDAVRVLNDRLEPMNGSFVVEF